MGGTKTIYIVLEGQMMDLTSSLANCRKLKLNTKNLIRVI
jgi:hypothetical protein